MDFTTWSLETSKSWYPDKGGPAKMAPAAAPKVMRVAPLDVPKKNEKQRKTKIRVEIRTTVAQQIIALDMIWSLEKEETGKCNICCTELGQNLFHLTVTSMPSSFQGISWVQLPKSRNCHSNRRSSKISAHMMEEGQFEAKKCNQTKPYRPSRSMNNCLCFATIITSNGIFWLCTTTILLCLLSQFGLFDATTSITTAECSMLCSASLIGQFPTHWSMYVQFFYRRRYVKCVFLWYLCLPFARNLENAWYVAVVGCIEFWNCLLCNCSEDAGPSSPQLCASPYLRCLWLWLWLLHCRVDENILPSFLPYPISYWMRSVPRLAQRFSSYSTANSQIFSQNT